MITQEATPKAPKMSTPQLHHFHRPIYKTIHIIYERRNPNPKCNACKRIYKSLTSPHLTPSQPQNHTNTTTQTHKHNHKRKGKERKGKEREPLKRRSPTQQAPQSSPPSHSPPVPANYPKPRLNQIRLHPPATRSTPQTADHRTKAESR